MKNKFVLFASVALLSLSACGEGNRYESKDYMLSYAYHDNFRILQLTDTHISDKDDQYLQYDFIESIINATNPDMIIVTGDLFTFAGKDTAKRYFDFLDSHNLPWTVTFGNHEEQCFFSIDWLTSLLNDYGSNCLFKDIQDDDVNGNANFAINLMKDNKIFEQLIIMDSNRYYFGEYFGYDFFKPNQIEWYKRLIDDTKTLNGGTLVESLMFYHIPLPEIDEAWDKAHDGSGEAQIIPDKNGVVGEKREKTCPPEYNSGFFDVIVEKGSTKAMFFGHDHVNNFASLYKGVLFSYGVKSDDRIYSDGDLLGGQVITLKNDHSIEIEQYFKTYEEVK